MLRWTVIAILLLAGLVTTAWAQTPTPTTPTAPGAFASLSPGGQKIAQALFEAQKTTPPTGTTGGTGTTAGTATAPKPLTLDEIAAKKQAGTGWGRVFKDMKAQGLVQDKNLGQVVSRYQHQHRPQAGRGVVTTGSGRESREHRGYAKRHGDDDPSEHGRVESGKHGRWEHGRGSDSASSASGRGWGGASGSGRASGGHGRSK